MGQLNELYESKQYSVMIRMEIHESIRMTLMDSETVPGYIVMLKAGNQSYILMILLKQFQIFFSPRQIHIL